VRRLVLRSTVVAAAIGVAAGLIATQALQRGFAWLIVEALPLDAATLAAVVAGSTALVLLACWLPARRASQVEPMGVLRSEYPLPQSLIAYGVTAVVAGLRPRPSGLRQIFSDTVCRTSKRRSTNTSPASTSRRSLLVPHFEGVVKQTPIVNDNSLR
jgi:hypothetical protein